MCLDANGDFQIDFFGESTNNGIGIFEFKQKTVDSNALTSTLELEFHNLNVATSMDTSYAPAFIDINGDCKSDLLWVDSSQQLQALLLAKF